MQLVRLILALVLLCLVPSVHAEIYKRVDAEGRITYSNVKTGDAVRLKIGHVAPKPRAEAPKRAKNVQKKHKAVTSKHQYRAQVSQYTQSKRDETRKQILLDELDTEKQALLAAQEAYKAGKAKPEVYRRRNADGSYATFRNVPKYRAKMDKLQAELDAHQRNVKLLEKEIDTLN